MSGSTWRERALSARAARDPSSLGEAAPFAAFLGIRWSLDERGELVATLGASPHLIGNPALPAVHGGAIASLLETAAWGQVLWEGPPERMPRPVTLTFDYLRPARAAELMAGARIVRRGRRVCTVRAEAWQEDRSRPVATANATLRLE